MISRYKPDFDAARWRSRIRPIGAFATLLLLLIVITALFLGRETAQRFSQMKTGWVEYAGDAGRKGVWISEIRGHFGYGGMIHNFKNLVLRRDKAYARTLNGRITKLYAAIDDYNASNPTEAERQALARVRAVVSRYEKNIPRVLQGMADGLDAEAIDARVRVDDREALSALTALETIWWQTREAKIGTIVRAISVGEELTRSVTLMLSGLIVLALIVFALMHMLMGHALRMTDRLVSELEARRKAQDAQKKLARVVEQSPTTILITDVEGQIEYVNRKFLDLTGFTADEVMGKTPQILKSGYTPDQTYRQIWQTLKNGQEWRGVFKNRKKDGEHYWASTAILPLTDDEGQITNFIGIGEDVTEKKLAREQMARAQKMEAVGLLAGGVSHDFNNVLMTIMGNVQLARLEVDELDNAAELDEALRHIELASRRAQGLIRQLLSFARRQPTRSRRLDLNAQIDEVLELMRASIPANIDVSYESRVEDAAIEADPTVLHQIIMNLCRNAAEAMGGEAGHIRLVLSRLGIKADHGLGRLPLCARGALLLQVCDDGPGMPDDVARNVFDPFFSTKPIGKGTGLGLAVVKNTMDDLGGRITLETEPGKGTCFSLMFPHLRSRMSGKQEQRGLVRGHEQILLVEDEEDVLYVLRRMLTRLGYRVEAYADPAHALAAFRAHPDGLDAVITDLMMPEISGFDLIRAVRDIKPTMPAILCSAYHAEQEQDDGVGNLVRLEKPVDISDLSIALREVLEEKKPG